MEIIGHSIQLILREALITNMLFCVQRVQINLLIVGLNPLVQVKYIFMAMQGVTK